MSHKSFSAEEEEALRLEERQRNEAARWHEVEEAQWEQQLEEEERERNK